MNARMRVNRAVQRSYEVTRESSNTLQSRDREHTATLRAGLIDATVQAIAAGSNPRLVKSRARP